MGLYDDVNLFEALVALDSFDEAKKFLMDLCTLAEIETFSERWKVCQLLACGKFSYREIRKLTGASLTTIRRVARFLIDEPYGGYRSLLEKTQKRKEK
ncbi:MAG: trp operon repressor [Holosporales bacterium]|nr:trp operon repressor [Holosporales bacterium]